MKVQPGGILMVAVADDTRYTPDSMSGVPKITPETVRAYRNRPHDFEKEFRLLQRENPVLAQELMLRAETHGRDIAEKRAFIEGALCTYWLISLRIHTARIEELFGPSTRGGDDDGDRPPSA